MSDEGPGPLGVWTDPAVGRAGVSEELRARVVAWIAEDPDPTTRDELTHLLAAGDAAALEERFAKPLAWGTAGLRGRLGAGPGRMNRLVVRRTTAALSRWILSEGDAAATAGIVIGRDARHGSDAFAGEAGAVALQLGLRVRTFRRPLPTPITAFAVLHLGATAGVMVTASHNPAADNGYKVYLADGAQIVAPYDEEIAAAAAREDGIGDAPGAGAPAATARNAIVGISGRSDEVIDEAALVDAYQAEVLSLLDASGPRDLAIVYTPMHGVGGAIVPDLLVRAGFARPRLVIAQAEPDPDFPTVAFPNPEEPGALDLAIGEATRSGAEIVIANDPDADRLAVAVPLAPASAWRGELGSGERGSDGCAGLGVEGAGFRVLTGDEIGILLADHLISISSGTDRLVATTIVSSSMLSALATERGVAYAETLTGFKWLARAARHLPGHRLLFAYEEALGYAVTDAVADKDGMSAAVVIAEIAAARKSEGRTLLDGLDDLTVRLGVHLTGQWSLRLEGADASRTMSAIVARWRSDPPATLAGLEVTELVDLALGAAGLPATDAVVVRAGRHLRVVIRPSGTEPKLKAYLEVVTPPPGPEELPTARLEASRLLATVRDEVARFCSA